MAQEVSFEEIQKIAHLARLSFSAEEFTRFFEDVRNIIAHFEKLNELDLEHVSPTSHISWSQPPTNSDEPTTWENSDLVLKHAPWVQNRYFIVPKIVDKEKERSS